MLHYYPLRIMHFLILTNLSGKDNLLGTGNLRQVHVFRNLVSTELISLSLSLSVSHILFPFFFMAIPHMWLVQSCFPQ